MTDMTDMNEPHRPSAEALIGSDWMRGGILVLWRVVLQDGRVMYSNGLPATDVIRRPDNPEPGIEPLTLSDEKARALLGALIRHYDGGEDTRSLRRDYDAERKRVDAFIAYLTGENR